jgi:predicted ATPase
MYFCSGQPMHFCFGVDTGLRAAEIANLTWPIWRSQGKPQQARELLAPIYGWFTEGFETRDLKDAKALLEEVAA